MEISKQLEQLLRLKGMNISQLAREVGVSSKTLHNWTTGQKPRDIDQVKRVADFFRVSIDELCFGLQANTSKDSFENHRDEIDAGVYRVILQKINVKK
ncbi:helix-turn-helix domain-containing protein [bacterium]|nr:helix-turn-helix domain-containing protein [bacterium]